MPAAPHEVALLRRIRALYAKADSTEFPHEAEVFLAKAQELMTRHAIDDAVVRRVTGTTDDEIVFREVTVAAPYASARIALLVAAARPNHCRIVSGRGQQGARRCIAVGHRRDVELAVLLFEQLDQQAARALRAAVVGVARPRSFRHAFLLSYGVRIGQRLVVAATASQADAEQRRGSSVALAIRDRRDAVDRALSERFPFTSRSRPSGSSASGFAEGRAAADRAALHRSGIAGRHELPRGGA